MKRVRFAVRVIAFALPALVGCDSSPEDGGAALESTGRKHRRDLGSGSPDMAGQPDLAAAPDLTPPPDLAQAPDLTEPADLGPVPDLTQSGPDLMQTDITRPVPSVCDDAVHVSTGGAHSCAIRSDGSLWCWGSNAYGQLGIGTTMNSVKPVQVTALGDAVAEVSAGGDHTCARKNDGTLWCWGANDTGQLGYNPYGKNSFMPNQASSPLGSGVAQVSSGWLQSCARKNDGTLWCWGFDTSPFDEWSPKQIIGLGNNAVDVSVGDGKICARKNDGTLWCWYSYSYITPSMTVAQVVDLGNTVVDVAAADNSFDPTACARKSDGTVWCWGSDQSIVGNSSPVVLPALGMSNAQLALGKHHGCVRQSDGTLLCWGYNNKGQLGNGTLSPVPYTQPAQVLGQVVQVSAHLDRTCARKGDGTIWCWGFSLVGDSTYSSVTSPTQVVCP